MDLHGFYTGAVFDAYEYLGGHLTEEGAVFRTYAPSARQVSVIGAFSGWAELPMERTANGQFWSCRVPGARAGQKYKYRVYRPDGSCLDRCDPYGFAMELRPQCASLLWDLDAYQFHDGAWMARRTPGLEGPVNIYELHAGSWRRHGPGETDWYSYRDLARELIPYLKERGYTHVELLPLAEHPSDASWGYQNTGFFSPTARYGSPDGLMELVDQCHQNGLGVILDFVSVHFAVDDYALWQYDGTPLYEYPNAAVGVSQWGSCNFIHARGDVRSFPPIGGPLLAGKIPLRRSPDGRGAQPHLLAGGGGPGRKCGGAALSAGDEPRTQEAAPHRAPGRGGLFGPSRGHRPSGGGRSGV